MIVASFLAFSKAVISSAWDGESFGIVSVMVDGTVEVLTGIVVGCDAACCCMLFVCFFLFFLSSGFLVSSLFSSQTPEKERKKN